MELFYQNALGASSRLVKILRLPFSRLESLEFIK